MSSLVNTLRRCHSTVRGLMNSCGADLGVRQSVAGEPGDLRLLRREHVARLDRALAHRLAGGQELAAGALGERLGADAAEHLVGGAQLLARVARAGSRDAATRRTPAGRGRGGRRCGCARGARSPRGRARSAAWPSLSSARDRARTPSAQSVPLARVRSSSCRRARRGDLAGVAAGARLDQLDERPAEEPEILVLARALRGGERRPGSGRGRCTARRSRTRPDRSLVPRPWRSRPRRPASISAQRLGLLAAPGERAPARRT